MKKILCFQFFLLFSSGSAYAESNDYFSLRTIFQKISETLTKIFNYIIDFNLSPAFDFILIVGLTIFWILFLPWLFIKTLNKDLMSWKKYHIGKKIMYPIWYIIALLFWSLVFRMMFLHEKGIWSGYF